MTVLTLRLIFRLLDKDRRLLGWTETFGRAPGDGTLRTSPVHIIAEEDGEACSVNVHWPDMHVITESPINPIPVKAGQAMVVGRPDDVIFKFEGDRRPLPPVTVRKSVAIEPPVGAVGVVGNR